MSYNNNSLLIFLLSVYFLLNSGVFSYEVYSWKGSNTNRIVSNTHRIAALMPGKALIIERYDNNCQYLKGDSKWITFPEDDVFVQVSYSSGKGGYSSKVYLEKQGNNYQISNSTLNSIRELDSAFECLINILLVDPIKHYELTRVYRYGRYVNKSCKRIHLKLQRLIEVYELLEHASSYQENNSDGILFQLTDPGFVVDYCKQNGYM